MVHERTYGFTFIDRFAARRFVERLTKELKKLAIHVNGAHVTVIDGSEDGQHGEIVRLARESGTQRFELPPPPKN